VFREHRGAQASFCLKGEVNARPEKKNAEADRNFPRNMEGPV
jgi:hypothetical protein